MALGGRSLREAIPRAVDEVGGPTILATFTVIAALLPMAFVSGLMGPYMRPIPINASAGMLLSLADRADRHAVARAETARPAHAPATDANDRDGSDAPAIACSSASCRRSSTALARRAAGASLFGGIAGLVAGGGRASPVVKAVILKMLPFDNKSEFQVVVDMPEGSTLERTNRVARRARAALDAVPEVENYQATPAPPRRSPSTAWCASTTCAAARSSATCRSTWSTRTCASARATRSRSPCGRRSRRSARATARRSRSSKCRPVRRCSRRSSPRSTGPTTRGIRRIAARARERSSAPTTTSSTSTPASRADAPRDIIDRRPRARCAPRSRSGRRSRRRCAPRCPATTPRICIDGRSKYAVPCACACRPAIRPTSIELLALARARARTAQLVPLSELVHVQARELGAGDLPQGPAAVRLR